MLQAKDEKSLIIQTFLDRGVYEYRNAFEMIRNLEEEGSEMVDGHRVYDKDNFALAHEFNKTLRWMCADALRRKRPNAGEVVETYRRALLFDAPYDFDSYCLYIEWDREPRKRFYEPRRFVLKQLVDKLQDLEDDKLDILAISLPPGVGKTTLAIFYLTWLSGRHPELQNIVSSHNTEFLRGVYGECMRIFDKEGEYLYADVFPEVEVCANNAKDLRIDLGLPKRFSTLEFSSIGSGNAGKIRATKLLYCDDLVSGIEEAMSKDRLDKLYQQYVTDLRQRKQGNVVKELHIATRWSIHDVISRLELQYEHSDRAAFINIPALNEDDESNFDYAYGVGFSTEFYHEQREIMDTPSWEALYMGHPIEREGTLYPPEEFRRYFDLPERDPDTVIAVLDIADGGGDYWAMPIVFQYGGDYYIVDWICDNNKPDVVEERIIKKLMKYNVQMLQCESNRAGGRVAENIEKRLKEAGQITRVTTKWNQTQKATRILVASGYVKQHFLFKDESLYRRSDKEYRIAMQQLCGYSMVGKNAHDDVPDSLSMMVDFISSFTYGHAQIIRRPF